jgi:hypothetical protein
MTGRATATPRRPAPSLQLLHDLARALGLPKNATRAVLTLQSGELPTLELTMLATDGHGSLVLEADPDAPDHPGGTVAQRIARVQFMVRLVPFNDLPTSAHTRKDA